jgi:hypothetical protein
MHIRQILVVGLVVTLGIAPLSAQKGGGGGGSTATVVGGPPELRVSNEIAAPGGIAQIKVTLTEPKPIMTGLFDFSGVGAVAGIAAFSPQNDTTGIAWPTATGLRIAAVSTLSDFGTDLLGYPLLTVTVHVPASAPIGSVIPIHLDPSSLALFDPNGVQYAATVTDGSITVGQVPAVEDVIPGSDVVPALGTIMLLGRNFNKDVSVQVDGADIDRVLLVSPSRMDVIIKSPLAMFARQIRLRTKTGNSFYYAYQRTTRTATTCTVTMNSNLSVTANFK